MIEIHDQILNSLREERMKDLAKRILIANPNILANIDRATLYVREAISVGIDTDRDIAEFAMLMVPIDAKGRPGWLKEIVNDSSIGGSLKVFQIGYALHGERP